MILLGGTITAFIIAVAQKTSSKSQKIWIVVRKDDAVQKAINVPFSQVDQVTIVVKKTDNSTVTTLALQNVKVNGVDYWGVEVDYNFLSRGDYIFTNAVSTPNKIYEKDFGITYTNDIGLITPTRELGNEDMIELRW
jgi:hypothetical protein